MSPTTKKPSALLKLLAPLALSAGALGVTLPSAPATACGGLFCNPATPVNQQAERILFVQDTEDPSLMQMHVRLNYQGEAEDFSWLLPVPPNTQFDISRETMFNVLDARFGPIFTVNRVTEGDCDSDDSVTFAAAPNAAADEEGLQAGGTAEEPRVQVTAREEVGPYDMVRLRANNVDVLIEWLTTNGFRQPDGSEEVLEPYLADYEFLAIKLRNDADSNSVTPVMLTFTGDMPTIPMRPTAVAANDDMGVIVHLLGEDRAMPSNYAHVEINDALIDWQNRGTNYSNIVSHAVDEADDGHAFVTDFAGDHSLNDFLTQLPEEVISRFQMATTLEHLAESIQELAFSGYLSDRDFSVFFRQALIDADLSEETVSQLLNFSIFCEFGDCFPDVSEIPEEWIDEPFMSQPLVESLNAYNETNERIHSAFREHSYLTRLFTTLNASEMDADPSFIFNQDLNDRVVPQTRTATLYQSCSGEALRIVTPSNLEIDLESSEPPVVERQAGETVRGQDEVGAALIERAMTAGPTEVISDNRPELEERFAPPVGEESKLLGCEQGAPEMSWLALALGLLLSAFRRRQAA